VGTGVLQQRRGVDYSVSSHTEVKNDLNYTFTLPYVVTVCTGTMHRILKLIIVNSEFKKLFNASLKIRKSTQT